ncbi:Rap1-interacting factor 1 N terminal-domain-containing protein [Apiosordaria backusii]|uniref:Rap1-interacting factor 1 N terminal-domain-containing protein n=1 Tax=Apiosordaria backusii TaxID=314023 RepID=A0AA40EYQ8_9PEZI|nr:Rap1-interacting factor 1 N terminal-domain-containing protein [Apiosordaria backusii]
MSSPAILSSTLSILPPRPPTPPKETHHEPSIPFNHTLGPIHINRRSSVSVHTPPGHQSPNSSITTGSTSRRRKKVGFSAQAEYKEAPVYGEGGTVKQHPTPVSLPRSASKPVKSILKITNHVPNLLDPASGNPCDPSNPNVNLAAMLESTIQQLAGGDRESKVDSYEMLTRALKTSNNLPDRVALQEKMGLFMQFIQRDIVSRTSESALDSILVNHALNMLITFLNFPAIASSIGNDFGIFIVDHCIRSFEDPATPKDIARRLMQVLSLQNFPQKVITAERVGKLVASLRRIEEHLTGKSIVLSRIFIYRKLVKQSRQFMIIHSDWLMDLFTDMLSSLKEIRSSAISFGLELAFTIGHEKSLSRKVVEIFNTSSGDQKYIQYYEERLKAMTKEKQDSIAVPDIWSVVILLLRIPLEKWEHSVSWLLLIQGCFNSSDFATKIAANRGWNRLTYFMQTDDRSFSKNISTLVTPLTGQLGRKGPGKMTEELRQAVLGCICNLLYYTFKPNTNPALLDGYWDRSVKPIIGKLLDPASEAAADNLQQATAILAGLFDCTTPRRWKDERIQDSTFLKPSELPPLDSKWVRHNAARVFPLVENILQRDFLALAQTNTTMYKLWETLVVTVASAAAKEIKVSKDTTSFVTEAFNVLQKVWKQGVPEGKGPEFLLAAQAYLKLMISSLGPLPFTEKPGKTQGALKAPLYTLFSNLSTLPPGVLDDQDYTDFLSHIFAPFFASKADKAKMDLAQDLLATIPQETPRPWGTWLLVAEQITPWLDPQHHSHHSTGSGADTPVGNEYRDIVKVLERGIRSTPNLPWKPWESLFYALFERVREETGDAGAAIVVIEPLSKVLMEQITPLGTKGPLLPDTLRCVTELVSVATQPRDRQAVDAARRRLWGTALAGSCSSSFDTFDNLYKAVGEALVNKYKTFDPADTDPTIHLLKEVGGFFDRCNRQLFLRTMATLQDGILPWLEDSNRQLSSQTASALAATKALWDKLASLITEIEQPAQQLESLERIFCASFASCHRSIVNSAVSLWNRLFENVGHLEYPEELKASLIQMQLHTDIVLPGLETANSQYAGQQQMMFTDSFEDFSLPRMSTRSSSRRGTPRATSSPAKSPASTRFTPTTKRRVDTSPVRKLAAANRRKATPKFRHDDSQIQFAAIGPTATDMDALESQALTERQKEVRERQKENAALFPEIRSSPRRSKRHAKTTEEGTPPAPEKITTPQAATPQPNARFDEYVSSTPTPRRGQPLMIPEHDMTDPPSSPPEPRRNPLAAEIRSRSASHSLLEEWQFSSSPISGSPLPTRHAVVPDPSGQSGFVTVVTLPTLSPQKSVSGEDKEEPRLPGEGVVEDSMVVDSANEPQLPKPAEQERHSTPPRVVQPTPAHGTPEPKSDEVFVDARSSPLPTSPSRARRSAGPAKSTAPTVSQRSNADNTSFEVSELDERSLLRLVVELDNARVDRQEYHQSSASPDYKGPKAPPRECIVVGDSPKKLTKPIPHIPPVTRRLTRSSSAASPELETIPSSQPTAPQRGRPRKRKRGSTRAQDPSKRSRIESAEKPAEEDEEVPHSQPEREPAHVQAQAPRQPVPAEVKTEEDPHEQSMSEIPSSSPEPSGPPVSPLVGQTNTNIAALGSPELDSGAMDGESHEHNTSDDDEVQSQIFLESFSASQRQDDDDEDEESVAQPTHPEEGMQIDEPHNEPRQEKASSPASTVEATAEERERPSQSGPVEENEDQIQQIMKMFRGGLDTLRSAKLSRQEVYQIEDMFMDMRRELYEAERRGRT